MQRGVYWMCEFFRFIFSIKLIFIRADILFFEKQQSLVYAAENIIFNDGFSSRMETARR